MRVVVVGPVPPIRSGIAQHTLHLIESLRASGHEVEPISWARQYPSLLYPGQERDASAPLDGVDYLLRWWDPVSWVRAGWRARRADLIVLPWVHPIQAVSYRTMLMAAGSTPSVAVVHNLLPHERVPLDELAARWVLRRFDSLITHAEAEAKRVESVTGRRVAAIVPHPSNLPLEPTPQPPGPPWRMLFFGYVRPYKGLDVALDAMTRIRPDELDLQLTVAGDFWEPPATWRRRITALHLEGRVDLRPGYVDESTAKKLFETHHLVLAPYRSATQSGIVPLAFAAGRPVVATDVGGIGEAVRDGVNGVLCRPDDPDALAAAITSAVQGLDDLSASAASSGASWSEVADAVVSAR